MTEEVLRGIRTRDTPVVEVGKTIALSNEEKDSLSDPLSDTFQDVEISSQEESPIGITLRYTIG